MRTSRPLAELILGLLLLGLTGCSSLGLSCFPTGHFLTKQSEEILNRSPRRVELPRELTPSIVAAHHLQPGDVLLIEPVDLESSVRIPADQQVMPDGSIDLGGFGRVIVAGLTIEAAESLIEQVMKTTELANIKINVRLLEPIDRYYVLGEVNSPGSYPLSGFETVLDGILSAGGLTSSAAPCKILLARPTLPGSCRVTLPVCYREIAQLGDTSTNYQLQPGDRIFVATRSWCEEMMFWQATKTCSRCCECQSACPNPEFALQRHHAAAISELGLPAVSTPRQVHEVPSAVIVPTPPGVPTSDHLEQGLRDQGVPEQGLRDQGATILSPTSPATLSTPAVTNPVSPPKLQDVNGFESGGANHTRPLGNRAEVPARDSDRLSRLPSAADGELDFGVSVPSDRFEPLWITSAR